MTSVCQRQFGPSTVVMTKQRSAFNQLFKYSVTTDALSTHAWVPKSNCCVPPVWQVWHQNIVLVDTCDIVPPAGYNVNYTLCVI